MKLKKKNNMMLNAKFIKKKSLKNYLQKMMKKQKKPNKIKKKKDQKILI